MLQQPEAWMRGPLPEVQDALQPVAHTLTQVREEVNEYLEGFLQPNLWIRPVGVASIGFHLQHLTGVLDRLFTYARGEALTPRQFETLANEGKENTENWEELLAKFNHQITLALEQLKTTSPDTIHEFRAVGRKQLPSTVLGLLFHAAEHSMRHTGQLLVTIKIIQNGASFT